MTPDETQEIARGLSSKMPSPCGAPSRAAFRQHRPSSHQPTSHSSNHTPDPGKQLYPGERPAPAGAASDAAAALRSCDVSDHATYRRRPPCAPKAPRGCGEKAASREARARGQRKRAHLELTAPVEKVRGDGSRRVQPHANQRGDADARSQSRQPRKQAEAGLAANMRVRSF